MYEANGGVTLLVTRRDQSLNSVTDWKEKKIIVGAYKKIKTSTVQVSKTTLFWTP